MLKTGIPHSILDKGTNGGGCPSAEEVAQPQSDGDKKTTSASRDTRSNSFSDDVEKAIAPPGSPPDNKVWHDGHWDEVEEDLDPDDDIDYFNDYIEEPERTRTNGQLFACQATQDWLRTLSGLSREGIPAFVTHQPARRCRIPLFQDGDGAEYQLNLSAESSLPEVVCPAVSDFGRPAVADLFQLRSLVPLGARQQAYALPRSILHLGSLDVRTTARFPQYFRTKAHATERTDYQVVVDVGSEDLPLWLLASRPRLRQRAAGRNYIRPIPPLPIFNSLMNDGDDLDRWYDAACFLSSVHKLASWKAGSQQSVFQEACELVRESRAIVDPAIVFLPMRDGWEKPFERHGAT